MDDQPFRGRQAVRDGVLTNYRLRARYRAIYRDVYVPEGLMVTAAVRARAAWLWAGGDCVLSGVSAAAVLGTKWLDGNLPAEFIRSDRTQPAGHPGSLVRPCARRRVRRARHARDNACANGVRHRSRPSTESGDTAPRRGDGSNGCETRRGAESPQESRVRLMLVRAGLPAPETQIEFHDDYGDAFIRVDMGWREWMVAVEYDGIQHWSDRRQRSWDIERVRAKLRWAGCPI